jgi:hypothetical protein
LIRPRAAYGVVHAGQQSPAAALAGIEWFAHGPDWASSRRAGALVVEHVGAIRGGQRDPGVRRAVVEEQPVAVAVVDGPAWETTLGTSPEISYSARGLTTPLRRSPRHGRGLIEVQHSEPGAVQAAGHRLAHAVVDDEPAVLGFKRRRPLGTCAGGAAASFGGPVGYCEASAA